MSQHQTVTAAERARAMGIDPSWAQCAGCPEEQYVILGRPGHQSICEECSKHCQCWKETP